MLNEFFYWLMGIFIALVSLFIFPACARQDVATEFNKPVVMPCVVNEPAMPLYEDNAVIDTENMIVYIQKYKMAAQVCK